MDRRETRSQDFTAFHEVPKIGETVVLAGVAATFRVGRRGVIGVTSMPELDRTARCVQLAVARMSRRDDAVEHVHATAYGLDDVQGQADAHEVTRRIDRHARRKKVEYGVDL